MGDSDKSLIHAIMGTLRKVMPGDPSGENPRAVRMFGRMLRLRELITDRLIPQWLAAKRWPVTSGSYVVGDKSATIAVCTLTSPDLMQPLSTMGGVAIAGELVTVNLGIEKIIQNTISNPNIRFLLLCGKESPVFHPAQALRCLFQEGIDDQRRIIEAEGHYPVLNNIEPSQIKRFRRQVELIDCTGERDQKVLQAQISELASRKKSAFEVSVGSIQDRWHMPQERSFKKI